MMSADLRARLMWLMLARASLATALGAGLVVLHSWLGAPELWGAWLSAIGPILLGSYALNALSWPLVTRQLVSLKPLGYLHLVADITTGALLMWHTGRLDSPLVFIPSVVVLFGALLFDRTGAWVSATLGTGAFLLISILEVSVMDFTRLNNVSETLRLLTLNTLIQIALVCVVATLASHLSERLRTAHLRLQVANQDLRTLRRLNERLLTRSQTGVLHLNARGEVLFANEAACELLKSTAQQLLGKPLFERFTWLSPPPAQSDAVERHVYWELEPPPASFEGERTHVTLACSLSQLSHHQEDEEERSLEGSALLIQDITRAQQRREEAKRRERLAELGTLAAQLAHELRNPLASMRSSLQLLERQLAPQEGEAQQMERRLLSIIDRETERLSQLTRSFLEVARPPTPHPYLTPLRPTLEALLELTSHTLQQLTLSTPPHTLQGMCVWVDPAQLQQILLNLIKNAHEAHEELEELEELEGAHTSPPVVSLEVEVEVEVREEIVQVSVLDRGPGLPQDTERLFTPFMTSKAQGSGLGLALSRALADANQGSLTAHEREGGGARFTLSLLRRPPEKSYRPVSDTLIQAIHHDLT